MGSLLLLREYAISIHTLHTEGDLTFYHVCQIQLEISIHTLHTEGDAVSDDELNEARKDFNPHPPHGG